MLIKKKKLYSSTISTITNININIVSKFSIFSKNSKLIKIDPPIRLKKINFIYSLTPLIKRVVALHEYIVKKNNFFVESNLL